MNYKSHITGGLKVATSEVNRLNVGQKLFFSPTAVVLRGCFSDSFTDMSYVSLLQEKATLEYRGLMTSLVCG